MIMATWGPSTMVTLTAPTSGATVHGSSVTLSATSSGSVSIASVQFKVDNSNIGSSISSAPYTTTWDSTGVADGAHTLYAVALGSNGSYATSSASVTVDNTAPSIPSSLTATATSSTEIDLSWTASTDNVGVAGYQVFRNSTQIATSTQTTYADQGLSASTPYTYVVKAFDGAGNVSASSTPAMATTLGGSAQVVIGTNANLSTSATTLSPLSFTGSAKTTSTVANASTTMPFAGTIQSLIVDDSSAVTGGQSWTFTVRKNNADSSVTCGINSSTATAGGLNHQQCSDLSHFVTFVAGDHIQISAAPSGTPSLGNINWSAKIVPAVANDTLLGVESAGTLNTSLESYYPFSSIQGVAPMTTQASTTPQVFGEAGTIKNLYASITTTSGVTATQGFTVMDSLISPNAPALASTTLTCTISNGTACNDTTHTPSVSAGDLFDMANVPTGTPGGTNYGAGMDFVPTTAGNFDLIYNNNATAGGNGTRYMDPTGTIVQSSTEASSSEVTNAMTVTSMYVWLGNGPGGAQTRIFTLMKNQASTTITCTITGPPTPAIQPARLFQRRGSDGRKDV